MSLILLLALSELQPESIPRSASPAATTPSTNRMGPAGAWFADVAFLLFGASAYLFPILVLIAGVFLFRGEELPERRPTIWRGDRFLLVHCDELGARDAALSIAGPARDGRRHPRPDRRPGPRVRARVARHDGAAARAVARRRVSSRPASRGSRSWIAPAASCIAPSRRSTLARRPRAIWWEGRRAKQQRDEVVTKVRAKPKTTAPRIEPVIEKIEVSARATERLERERQVPMFEPPLSNELPALSLLDDPPPKEGGYSAEALEAMSRLVELKLNDFGVEAEVVAVHPGPVVTRFELKPAAGVKSSQISNLAKDLARSLATVSVRVVEIIPGKPYVGLEIPNEVREIVALGEIVKSQAYDELKSPLTFGMGKSISVPAMCADLAAMPHLLAAGATGSGKSVAINALLSSIIMKAKPEDVRMILVDPKMLELAVDEGIPHLLMPVITEPNKASLALKLGRFRDGAPLQAHAQPSPACATSAASTAFWPKASEDRKNQLREAVARDCRARSRSLSPTSCS